MPVRFDFALCLAVITAVACGDTMPALERDGRESAQVLPQPLEPARLVKFREVIGARTAEYPIVLIADEQGSWSTGFRLLCNNCDRAVSAFGFTPSNAGWADVYDSMDALKVANGVPDGLRFFDLQLERAASDPAVIAAFRVTDAKASEPRYLVRLADEPDTLFATSCDPFLRFTRGSIATTPITRSVQELWGATGALPRIECAAGTPALPPPAPAEMVSVPRAPSWIVDVWAVTAPHRSIRAARYPFLIVQDASGARRGFALDCGSQAENALRSFGVLPGDYPVVSDTAQLQQLGFDDNPVLRCGGTTGASILVVTSANTGMPTTRFRFDPQTDTQPALVAFTCPETEAYWSGHRIAKSIDVPYQALAHLSDSGRDVGKTRIHAIGCRPTPGWVRDHLKRITSRQVVLGQNELVGGAGTPESTRVQQLAGRAPGLWSAELTDAAFTPDIRRQLLDRAVSAFRAGSIVRLAWKPRAPIGPASHEADAAARVPLSDAQWTELLTPGAALHEAWMTRLNELADLMVELKRAGVIVIFAPLEGLNQSTYWWQGRAGATGSRELWRITHDYLVRTRGLDHLVWEWNIEDRGASADPDRFYPGDAYADVLSCTAPSRGLPSLDCHDALRDRKGKPIAIGELAVVPTRAQLEAQPDWSYLTLSASVVSAGTANQAQLQALYADPRAMTQGQIPFPGSGLDRATALNLARGKAVFASSSRASSPDWAPQNALDGFGSTRWASAAAGEQWFSIDLGAEYEISRIRLDWDDAYAIRYELKTSLDGKDWPPALFSTHDARTPEQSLSFAKTKARWVGLYLWRSAATDRYGLREITVLP